MRLWHHNCHYTAASSPASSCIRTRTSIITDVPLATAITECSTARVCMEITATRQLHLQLLLLVQNDHCVDAVVQIASQHAVQSKIGL